MSGRERATNNPVSIGDVIKRPLFPLGLVTVVFATLFAGFELYQRQVITPWNELLDKNTLAAAKLLANQLETRLFEIDERLTTITKNPSLSTALISNDHTQLEATKSRLRGAWPELNGLIVVPRRFEEGTIGDNFIAIDLLRRANAGGQPCPWRAKSASAGRRSCAKPLWTVTAR